MRKRLFSSRWWLTALAVVAFMLPLLPADEAFATKPGFLQQVADTTTDAHDTQTWSGTTKGIEQLDKGFQKALEQGLTKGKYADMAGKAGKYVKILDYVLKGIKFANLSNKCRTALMNGDRDTFISEFNNLVREGVKTVAGMGGATVGATWGGGAGAAAGGGVFSIVTGGLGALAGGWLGDYIASSAAEAAYDEFIADWIKNRGGDIFDSYHGGNKPPSDRGPPGTGLPVPPGDDGDKDKDKDKDDDKGPVKLESFGT